MTGDVTYKINVTKSEARVISDFLDLVTDDCCPIGMTNDDIIALMFDIARGHKDTDIEAIELSYEEEDDYGY
jgi:hypothetical protein